MKSNDKSLTPSDKSRIGKPQYAALPSKAITEVARVLEMGSRKHGRDTFLYEDACKWSSRADKVIGHFLQFWEGKEYDEEANEKYNVKIKPLAFAICQALFLLEYDLRYPDYANQDDRPIVKEQKKGETKKKKTK